MSTATPPNCDVCDEKVAQFHCQECKMSLCSEDDLSVHKPAKLAGHKRVTIGGEPESNGGKKEATITPASVTSQLCELCEDKPSTMNCKECDQSLCRDCDTDLHKPAKMASHTRTLIGGAAASASNPSSTVTTSSSSSSSNSTAAPAARPSSASSSAASRPLSSTPFTTPAKSSSKPSEEEKNQFSSPPPSDPSSQFMTPTNVTPLNRSQRPFSGSASATSLGRPRSSSRPRSALSSASGSNSSSRPKLEVPPSLAFAPRTLQQALSPQRNVLSMSYGSRWEEPDLRPFKGGPGTFGSSNRDGSPKKERNLLYSKSASDLLGSYPGGGGSNSGKPSPATWDRLARPKVFVSSVISPLFDDNKNCTFKPAITPLSQSIASGQFNDRLQQSVKLYKDKRLAPEGTGWHDPDATFKPKLNDHSKFTKATSADFVSRMYDDLNDRKTKLREFQQMQRYTFQPEISSSSKKRAATITTPFLDRLKEDLDARDDGIQTRKAESEKLPWAFMPNPERHRANFNVFLGRMEQDLDQRKEKYEERCRKFGIPPPDEVAAMVRGASAKRR